MKQHLDDLKEIRQLMERSSKFLSLSGLSGIGVGVVALVASAIVYYKYFYYRGGFHETTTELFKKVNAERIEYLVFVAIITFLLAIIIGLIFTARKAKQKSQKVWNAQSKKMLLHLAIPLAVGGILGIALLKSGVFWPLPGVTLLFYGLALINASHFTYRDVFFLGIFETILGLIALFWVGYSLLFWALGFGVLHIVYGTIMYFKYDK